MSICWLQIFPKDLCCRLRDQSDTVCSWSWISPKNCACICICLSLYLCEVFVFVLLATCLTWIDDIAEKSTFQTNVHLVTLSLFRTIMTNSLYRDWEKCFHLRPISKLDDASSSNVCGRSCGVVRCTSGQDPAHERADEMSPWGASYSSSSWSIPISQRCLSLSRMPPKRPTNTCYMAHFGLAPGQSIPEEQIRNLFRKAWEKEWQRQHAIYFSAYLSRLKQTNRKTNEKWHWHCDKQIHFQNLKNSLL